MLALFIWLRPPKMAVGLFAKVLIAKRQLEATAAIPRRNSLIKLMPHIIFVLPKIRFASTPTA